MTGIANISINASNSLLIDVQYVVLSIASTKMLSYIDWLR